MTYPDKLATKRSDFWFRRFVDRLDPERAKTLANKIVAWECELDKRRQEVQLLLSLQEEAAALGFAADEESSALEKLLDTYRAGKPQQWTDNEVRELLIVMGERCQRGGTSDLSPEETAVQADLLMAEMKKGRTN